MRDARFDKFISFIIDHETEYKKGHWGNDKFVLTEKDPDDDGNYYQGKLIGTRYGLDARTHGPHVGDLSLEDAKEIYYYDYWTKFGCNKLNSPLAECHMDACVNCGPTRANKFLSISKEPNVYIKSREDFYHRLAAAKEKSRKYLKGWLNRCNDLRTFLKIAK